MARGVQYHPVMMTEMMTGARSEQGPVIEFCGARYRWVWLYGVVRVERDDLGREVVVRGTDHELYSVDAHGRETFVCYRRPRTYTRERSW